MKISKVTIICSWLATVTFMSGFLVFIIKPWSLVEQSPGSPGQLGPLAAGLVHDNGIHTDKERRKQERRKRRKEKRKLESPEEKEERLLKRRARMLKEQEEYRQWRRDVIAGVVEEEDPVEAALEELWTELFDETLDLKR